MVFGKVKEVRGHQYCYVVKSIRVKNKENPKTIIVKYFGNNFEGFYDYLEKKGLFKGAVIEKLNKVLQQ